MKKSNFTNNNLSAQGALEYLLILVAVIIVVAIVVIFINGFTSNAVGDGAEQSKGTIFDSFTSWANNLYANSFPVQMGANESLEIESTVYARDSLIVIFGSTPNIKSIEVIDNSNVVVAKYSQKYSWLFGENYKLVIGDKIKITASNIGTNFIIYGKTSE